MRSRVGGCYGTKVRMEMPSYDVLKGRGDFVNEPSYRTKFYFGEGRGGSKPARRR